MAFISINLNQDNLDVYPVYQTASMNYFSQPPLIPIYYYPGGQLIDPPTENVTYKWMDHLGGGVLPGPIRFGTRRPDGKLAHNAIATKKKGRTTVEYYRAM